MIASLLPIVEKGDCKQTAVMLIAPNGRHLLPIGYELGYIAVPVLGSPEPAQLPFAFCREKGKPGEYEAAAVVNYYSFEQYMMTDSDDEVDITIQIPQG